MAHIYKRKDKWAYVIDVGLNPATGKRKQKTKSGFKTKKEAQQAAVDMQRTFNFNSNDNITFEEVFNDFWASHKTQIKPSTIKNFEALFGNHILPYFAKLKIAEINRRHCQDFINAVFENRPGSMSAIKSKANQVFKYALQEELINKNPMQNVVVPKKSEDEIIEADEKRNYWQKNEVNEFMTRARDHLSDNDALLFELLIFSGMRKGEALALNWSDIDHENKMIKINKTLFFDNGQTMVQSSKTKSGRRSIDIDENLLKKLQKFRLQQKEKFLGEKNVKDQNIVFTRPDGRYMRLAQVNEVLAYAIKKMDMHKITVHGLRHTHASLLFEAGADIKYVQQRLGHADIKMTLDIYTHVTETQKQKTASIFSQFMSSN